MKIYNHDKTQVLNESELDLVNGYLINDCDVVHYPEVKETQEREVDNGYYDENGELVEKKEIIKEEVVTQVEHDEYVPCKKYFLYPADHFLCKEKSECLRNLTQTDYVDNKILEAMLDGTADEIKEKYKDALADRKAWRKRINEIEQEIERLKGDKQ